MKTTIFCGSSLFGAEDMYKMFSLNEKGDSFWL
jgi:hypothetical protein